MMIRVQELHKSLGGQKILEDINLRISEGDIVAILGESGAGKSVLLKHFIGLFEPDQGAIFIDSQEISRFSERQWLALRKKIGYLFQEGALYDFMTVFENIAFPLKEHTALDSAKIAEKVFKILEMVDLKGVQAKFPSELSGGMRKRAALARSVILDSKFLFCDEPTSGLDPIRSREIMDLIRDISKKLKTTTVLTSHDVNNSFRIADQVVIIRNGTLVAKGTPQELRTMDDFFIREFLK